MRFLLERGYDVTPVNPDHLGETIHGRTVVATLDEAAPLDMVDVFRRSEFVAPVVDAAIRLGAKSVWMQLKVIDEGAAAEGARRRRHRWLWTAARSLKIGGWSLGWQGCSRGHGPLRPGLIPGAHDPDARVLDQPGLFQGKRALYQSMLGFVDYTPTKCLPCRRGTCHADLACSTHVFLRWISRRRIKLLP